MNAASRLLRALKVSPLKCMYALGELFLAVMALPVAATVDLLIWTWNLLLKFVQMICLVVTLKLPKGGLLGLLKRRFQKISFPL